MLGISQFWVAARGPDGRRREARTPITVRDTAEGRWLARTTTVSGQRRVLAAPSGPQPLASKLHEVLRGLTSGTGA